MSRVLSVVVSPAVRVIAGAVVLALVVGLLGLVAMTSSAAHATTAHSGKNLAASSIAEAMALAAKSGAPTRVSSLTTEDTVVEATPEGPLRAVMSLQPERFRENGDGDWVEIDTDLVDGSGGMLRAAAVEGSVEVSNGGAKGTVLASFTTPTGSGSVGEASRSASYELLTPFDLPQPAVVGAVATFTDVIPAVDLVVEAKPVGFSYFFVLKDRSATQSPAMAELRMPMRLNGLKPRADSGGTAFVDDAGHRVVWSGTPMMWDAKGGKVAEDSGEEATEGPAPADQVAVFDAAASASEMVLKPDMSLLTSADTSLPIVIDPASSKPLRTGWTAVWSNYPDKSFWQTEHSLGAGYEGWEQNKKVRSYFRFPIVSTIRGSRVLSAAMNVTQTHAAQCKEHPTEVYRTDPIGTATTWNRQPARGALQSTRYSYVGCGSGQGWVGWNVLPAMQNVANQGVSTATFMIRAKDETNKYAWKQFDDYGAKLEISYMPYPDTPSVSLKDRGGVLVACGTSSDPAIVTATSVQLGATVSINRVSTDPLWGVFGIENIDGGGTAAQRSSTSVSSGRTAWATRTVTAGDLYRIRARTRVYLNSTSYLESPSASGWCYFKADTSAPQAPKLESTDFLECATPNAPQTCSYDGPRFGSQGTFKVTAQDVDVIKYQWWLDKPAAGEPQSRTTITTASGGAKTFSFTPFKTGHRKIYAIAIDEGHPNGGGIATFEFWVSSNTGVAEWTFNDSAGRNKNTGRAGAAGNLSSPMGDASVSEHGRDQAGLKFTGGAPATATVAGVSTSTNFTVDAWIRASTADSATFIAATSGSGDTFELGYDSVSRRWVAGRRESGETRYATSSALAGLGQWAYLVGSFEASTKTMTLYVNGVKQGSATYATSPTTSTAWQLGCGASSLSEPRCASGMVDEVSLWDYVMSAEEVQQRFQLRSDVGMVTSTAALWDMASDVSSAGVITDRAFGAKLAVSGAGSNYLDGVIDGNATVPALSLPGDAGQQVSMPWSPVSTSTSFTVGALVRVPEGAHSGVIAQQTGSSTAAWTLGYRVKSDGASQFYFRMATSDAASAPVAEARVDVGMPTEFNAVTAVFDATDSTRYVKLYLNGGTRGDDDGSAEAHHPVDEFAAAPWQAAGGFGLGNGTIDQTLNGTKGPLTGDIATVKVVAGALSSTQIGAGADGVTPPEVDVPVVPVEESKALDVDFADGVANERVQGLAARTWGAPTYGTDASLSTDGPIGVMKVDGVDDAVSFTIDPWAELADGFTLECVFRIETTLPVASERDLCSNKEAGGFGIYVQGSELRTSAHIGGAYQVITTPAESNRWYHVVSVWDGTTLALFVNGIRVGDTAASGELTPPVTGARWFVIGGDTANSGAIQFAAPPASFAHAAIYTRGITAQEIATMAAPWNTAPLEDPTADRKSVV